jgi:hypothetical protein
MAQPPACAHAVKATGNSLCIPKCSRLLANYLTPDSSPEAFVYGIVLLVQNSDDTGWGRG